MEGSPRISDQAVYDLTSYSHCSFITNYRIKSLLKTLKSLEVEAVTPRGCLTGSSLRLARTTITANYCLATTAPPPASASTLAEVLWPGGASDLWEVQTNSAETYHLGNLDRIWKIHLEYIFKMVKTKGGERKGSAHLVAGLSTDVELHRLGGRSKLVGDASTFALLHYFQPFCHVRPILGQCLSLPL